MILDYTKFNSDLEPLDKFHKYHTADKSLVSRILSNLYFKPELAYSFDFFDIIFLKNFFLSNYLLEKLELFNKVQFINYMQTITYNYTTNINCFNYICNDYKLYNLLWNNIPLKMNLNNFLPLGSLLFKLEFYLVPLIYNLKKNDNIIIDEKKNYNYQFFKKIEDKEDYLLFKNLIKKKLFFFNEIFFDDINLNKNIMCEEILSIHINFENNVYSLINIIEYNKFLIKLKVSLDDIQFYLSVAKNHNLMVQNLSCNIIAYASFKYTHQNFKCINLTLLQIKDYELKKSLSEFNTYMEFSFKTV